MAKTEYELSFDSARFDVEAVHAYLSTSYWAAGIPESVLRKAMENSLCVGAYAGTEQVGFARVVTDRATFAYLADVFVLESHRGRGLGVWLMECIKAHPDLQGLRRWILGTRDAHGLYRKIGFRPLAEPSIYMEIMDREVYGRS